MCSCRGGGRTGLCEATHSSGSKMRSTRLLLSRQPCPSSFSRLMTRYALAMAHVGLRCLRNSMSFSVFQRRGWFCNVMHPRTTATTLSTCHYHSSLNVREPSLSMPGAFLIDCAKSAPCRSLTSTRDVVSGTDILSSVFSWRGNACLMKIWSFSSADAAIFLGCPSSVNTS
jgi:hypothetical protein